MPLPPQAPEYSPRAEPMIVTTIRLKCYCCETTMRGRRGERDRSLHERAERSGWRQVWYGNPSTLIDACQVCAPKIGG